MTTPLNKLAEKWRKDAYSPRDDIEVNSHYESGYEDAKRECANELEAALTAHNQRWLDLADDLEHRSHCIAATEIRQLAKEMGSE